VKAPKVLVINGCASVEGDVTTLLLALKNMGADKFQPIAAPVPRGKVFEEPRERVNIRLIPIELGRAEARRTGREGKTNRIISGCLPFHSLSG
jgi:hypothetical protein